MPRPLAAAAVALLLAVPAYGQAPRLGTVDFPTSGAPAAQEPFVRGVLYLHSFEYASAARAFREAQRLDPGFAMAYWGEAMTYTHPIWNEQNRDTARAVLNRLGPTPEARRARAPTPRERAWLEAVEVLYGEGSKAQRDTAYSLAMSRLADAFPDDDEARAFHALSQLGLSQGVRDVPTYLRAAAIAEEIFRDNPNHPGAAHYLIHAYDDPVHAPLGLRAARAYSRIAPDAAHAQHMTTHIFVAMGMWDEVVSQNEIAANLTAWTPGHYTDWLGYGLLQQGRRRDALAHLTRVRGNMGEGPRQGHRWHLADMRAQYVVNTEDWNSPVLRWTIDVAGLEPRIRAEDQFVLGWAALKRGDRAAAEQALVAIADLARGSGDGEPDRVPTILEKELRAALAFAEGRRDEALGLMREAAALEDAMPLEFGPPAVVKPTHELLGEMLLELEQPRAAQGELERALRLAPMRAPALLGLGRAAAAAGDRQTAARAFGQLRDIWRRADPGVPGLEEAARFVSALR